MPFAICFFVRQFMSRHFFLYTTQKITSLLLKELDIFARNGIKDELASLDPLLRNIKVDDEGV